MMKTLLCAILSLAFFLSTPGAALAAAQTDPQPVCSEMEAAYRDGWVSGYPDGTFRPEAPVSRCEFAKLLLAAAHLTPGSPTAAFLHAASGHSGQELCPPDLKTSWLTTAGWTQVALDFGLIRPDDCPEGRLEPNAPLNRQEAAVMAVRLMGLVYPAEQARNTAPPFTDADAIPQNLQGYACQAVSTGIMDALPDGSFAGSQSITRAQAVAMVARVLSWMEQGVDPAVEAFVRPAGNSQTPPLKLSLSAPAQIIDATVYLPARDVLAGNAALYADSIENQSWDPVSQQLSVTLMMPFQFAAGDCRYECAFHPISDSSWTFPVPARLLYGELMIPVCSPITSSQTNLWPSAVWDPVQKTVTVSLYKRYPGMS